MSPAAVRMSSAIPLAAPVIMKPRMSAGAESTFVASATRAHPAAADRKPPATTGRRPTRSIARPAGRAVTAEATRKIAGPRPRRPSIPVTSTNVMDETAATSCSTAE
jgi:hypothetical protein